MRRRRGEPAEVGRKGHECQAAVGRPCHQVAFIRIPGVITLGSAGISNPGSDGNRVRSAPFPFENRRYGGRTIQETFARGDIHTPLQGQGVAVLASWAPVEICPCRTSCRTGGIRLRVSPWARIHCTPRRNPIKRSNWKDFISAEPICCG